MNQKVLIRCSLQQDQIPSHGQGVERGGFTQMKLTFIAAALSRNAGKIVLPD